MIEEKELFREFEKRERLVQTFLLIGGFFLAITTDTIKPTLGIIFSVYLLFIILYYVFVSRTKMSMLVDVLAFLSSYIYSLFILIYFNSMTAMDSFGFISAFVVLTLTITYSLLSPDTSNRVSIWFENFFVKQEKNHPKSVKAVLIIISLYAIYKAVSIAKLPTIVMDLIFGLTIIALFAVLGKKIISLLRKSRFFFLRVLKKG